MKTLPKLALLLPLLAPMAAVAEPTPPGAVTPSAAAVAPAPAALPADVAAQAGSARLTVAQLQDMLNLVDPAQRQTLLSNPTALANFARGRVLDMAVLAEARGKGWDKTPTVQERAQQAYDNVVVQTYLASLVPVDPKFPSDEDLAKFFDANHDRLIVPRQFHLAQIVILVPPGATSQQDEAARTKAAQVRALAVKRNSDFAELARRDLQEKTSAAKGGDVGFLNENNLLPVVRDAVLSLPEGGVTEPLRATDGWHVVKLLATKPAAPATLDEVRPQLIQAMRQARAQAVVRNHLQQMMQGQLVQVNDAALAKLATPAH